MSTASMHDERRAGDLLRDLGWYEWLCHTNFSFLVGASHPKDYLQQALHYGYHGIGVTDFDGLYGLARTWRNLRELTENSVFREAVCAESSRSPLRLFCGAEIHLEQDHDLPVVYQNTLALIVRSKDGYRNLCRLVTWAHRDGKKKAFVSLEDLRAFAARGELQGLTALQPMRGMIRRGAMPEVMQHYAQLKDLFASDLYLVLSRHFSPAEDVWIRPSLELGETLGLGFILSQDPFFHRPAQKDVSDVLHAVRHNLTVDEAVEHMFPNSERSFHSLVSIARRFAALPVYETALRNSRELASRVDFDLGQLRYRYPKEMIPSGFTAQEWLERVVWDSAKDFYGESIPARVSSSLSHELDLVARLGFADYFLTVWDIVRWARSQGILCQGRGSAANSAVCFVLGITSVDPSLNDLLFERFISVERGDPPDIDVDFEHERREEVIQYIYRRYGRARAAMVANVITWRRRGAIRAVGKALGVPQDYLEKASVLLSSRYYRGTAAAETVNVLREESATCDDPDVQLPREPEQDSDELPEGAGDDSEPGVDDSPMEIPWEIWGQFAERLRGFPTHLGIHSGGFMLSDEPLENVVPQEPATMEGRTVIQWCKDDIEALGFFKIDMLSLGILTAIRKCFGLIQQTTGKSLSIATVPPDDEPTYAMIQRADTVGTFQIESRAQMSMLPRLRPRCFYDLVIEVAIIRPGPIQGGMIHPYLRRRHGLDPVVFPDERLRPILARTLGIPIFQEQVMRIAIAVGDFTPGEANELRRHMGAWSIKGDIDPWLKRLADGMRRNGIKEEFVQTILSQMRGFADYGFPESHAASFAILAYVSSWLKCHHPAAFFVSLINSQPMGFYTPHALLQAAMRAGVKVLPVCVLHSDWDLTLENLAKPGRPDDFAIRLGLRMVRSLREEGARTLVQRRSKLMDMQKAQPTLQSFLNEVRPCRPDLTALAAAGAFRVFGLERRAALWFAEAAPFCPVLEDVESPVCFGAEGSMESVQMDFAATGTSLGDHPTTIVRRDWWSWSVPESKIVAAEQLSKVREGGQVHVFGMILVRQAPPSANGMVFLTLEDATGFINLALTPQVYEKFFRIIDRQAFLCVSGKLQKFNEGHSVMVRDVHEPRFERAEVIPLQSVAEPQRAAHPLAQGELQRARSWM
jgi:error-prone DNA polymerase